MKIAFYSTHKYEKEVFDKAAERKHQIKWIEAPLNEETAILSKGADAVCIFVNDEASSAVLQKLEGIKFLLLRSAGFNHVDLKEAAKIGLRVGNVPEYSPYAVAEHAVALMMALNRKLIRANSRVREGNFSLDGLTGFDMHGKTVGIIGFGKIGQVLASIMKGFGCKVLVTDPIATTGKGYELRSLDELCKESDIISLHAPLNEETKYMIDKEKINEMKKGVMLINTGRGGLINTKDVVRGLKNGKIGYLGLDVYEEEKNLFFEDHSGEILQDDVIARLMTFPNVLITSHQAFLTQTSLRNIAETTISNADDFEKGRECRNELGK